MSDRIVCPTHGELEKAYVCCHLIGNSAGLGFNSNSPTDEQLFPDAWCDDCELIRASHGGWNKRSEKLTRICLVCSECYKQARIRNTHAAVTLDDLATLKWKCTSCNEWHSGPCLDFSYNSPIYWTRDHEAAASTADSADARSGTFLNEDYCVIDDRDFFVRGLIKLPIIGTTQHFCWGVWGSLSRQNFELLVAKGEDPVRTELPPMFSWLSNQISEYPDTLNLKMNAHIQKPGERPLFEIESTAHPLSEEYQNGISPEKVKKIMLERLRQVQ